MCERISWLVFLLGKLKARLQLLHILISASSAESVAKLVDPAGADQIWSELGQPEPRKRPA